MADTVTTTVTELPDSRVRVQAEVAPEEVERRIQQAARELGRQLRVPGFRKGKVPAQVVIRRLGRETVLDEALRSSLGSWYADAIEGAGIAPVGEPDLDVPKELPAEGQPLSFSIEIGVRPTAKLGQYKGLEVGRREPHAEDSQIDEEIDRLRDRLATLETVDRPAQDGDHVVMDYVGTVDGEEFEGGSGRDQLLELGSGRLVPGFEEQLTGAGAGEDRTVTITFPEDYPATELAGKQAQFAVTVNEVKEKRLPELDDEFAAEAAGFDTLAELRADIAERLGQADERAIEREFDDAVVEAAVAEADVEVPEKLVHARAHELLEDTFTMLGRQGISKDAYLRISGRDEETLAHEAEPEAAAALKREAVLAAIVEAENIEPSDDDVREALAPTAERQGTPVDKLFERLRSTGSLDRIRQEVAIRQAIELLVAEATPISVEQAKAREKLWTPGKERESHPPGDTHSPSGQLWTPGN
ncbi:MAG TPA: trigger factor [Solirubrobacteraceae bacterium]|nr:trigger factor [Solirubrobacteraceae bacterium]